MAFSARIRVYHAWQAAEQEARRVHREHERNRAQGRIAQDRIPHALNLVADVRICHLKSPDILTPDL